MTTVRVLVDAVGEYNEGDIVKNAPPGLVHMARVGTKNAATGQLIAELVDDDGGDDKEELKQLKARAKELKVEGYGKMSADELKVAIANTEKEIADADELKELQAKATELKIPDFEKFNRDELIAAIEAAGGGQGAQ